MSRSPYVAVLAQVVLVVSGCVAGAVVDGDGGTDGTSTSCQNVSTCAGGDGCCPATCSPTNDSDCSLSCGNGIVEAPEICDGDCPTACDDGDPCTGDVLTGSATTCNAQCIGLPIEMCRAGDGCCPATCTGANDADCCGGVELCNGTNDDCDAVVDDGCPSGFTLGAPVSCGCAFGGSGGTAFALACGAGQVLVGFDGKSDHSVTQLRPACASLSWVATPGTPEGAFELRTTGSTLLANAGDGADGSTFGDRCPANQVVVGIHGRWGDIPLSSRDVEVQVFGFSCGALTIARASAGGPWQLTVMRASESADHGGTISLQTPYEYLCPAGNVATVLSGRAGERIDQVGLGCSPLALETL